MNLFREVADIQTADMLNLPVPKANYETITVEPSEIQKKLVTELSMRAEDVREKRVSPEKDNMLRITNDGRKLALDQRIIDPMLPEAESGKVAVCAEQIYRIWQESKAARLTQLVFCDLSTPNARKENNMEPFSNVYESLKEKLLLRGVPEQEIAFIHDADTEVRKKELFAKVRTGQVRILLGSTQKMGAGTNVQDKLIALHDLDCPWRPSDLEQRSGRIIRQGNQNEEVYVYRYVTKDTFDAYLYQTVENKQRFISQIMTEKSPVRSAEDIDEAALSYAEIKMLATGNPLIKEKMDLDIEVSRLKLLKSSHLNQKYRLEDQLVKYYPIKLKSIENHIFRLERDCQTLKEHPQGEFKIVIHDQTFTNRNDAGTFLLASCQLNSVLEEKILGNYRGFAIIAQANTGTGRHEINLKGETSHFIEMSSDPVGMIMRIENKVERIPIELQNEKQALDELRRQIQNAEAQVQVPFVHEEILREKMKRLDELDAILNNSDESIVLEDNISTESSSRKPKELER